MSSQAGGPAHSRQFQEPTNRLQELNYSGMARRFKGGSRNIIRGILRLTEQTPGELLVG